MQSAQLMKSKVLFPNELKAHGILSGGRPSEENLRDAAAAGYKTIINLQMEHEEGVAREREILSELGLTYVAIPVAGAAGITVENAAILHRELEKANEPVIVHCAGGNRVGALMALRAFHYQGLRANEALKVGKETGLRGLEPMVIEHLNQASPIGQGY